VKSASELWLENHPKAVERNELLPKVDTKGQLWKQQQVTFQRQKKQKGRGKRWQKQQVDKLRREHGL